MSERSVHGVAGLFDDTERKQLFRKYLLFLGWTEVAILVVCFLYQLGNQGYDASGTIPVPFPWKVYFAVSFLAPVAITFVIGMVIVGFNKYLTEPHRARDDRGAEGVEGGRRGAEAERRGQEAGGPSGRIEKFQEVVHQLQSLPFLTLLLLLAAAVGIVYKLDTIMAFVNTVGEKSVKIVLVAAGVLLAVLTLFAFMLLLFNYKLRKRTMEYQYKSDMGERFGLIILEDNTVISREGRLLIQGKKWKDTVPLLPAASAANASPPAEAVKLPHLVESKR
jgi:hypothetical protein